MPAPRTALLRRALPPAVAVVAAAILAIMMVAGVVTPNPTATIASAQGSSSTSAWDRIPDLVDEVAPSVVAVLTDGGEGSGVIFSSDGVVVTNNHVVADAGSVTLLFADGTRSPAQVVATDPRSDLAVLRTDRTGLPAATFAEGLPRVGSLAVSLGNPLGFENTASAGIVSGLNRSFPGAAAQAPALIDLIQTDAPISPGNSGGALVGADGSVIGVNVAFVPPEARAVSIGFAIPAPTVVDVVEQLLEDGEVDYAFFGAGIRTLSERAAEQFGLDAAGVLLERVLEGAPAARAGLAAGDLVIRAGGERVRTAEDFLAVLRDRAPGDRLELVVERDGERRTVEVELADRPE